MAKQAPAVNQAVVRASAPVLYQEAMGLPKTDLVTLPADPIQTQPTYEAALAAFEEIPSIRVLFDNGAGTSPLGTTTAGDPYPGFEQSFSTSSRSRARRRGRGTSDRAGRSTKNSRPRKGRTPTPPTQKPCR